MSSRGIIFDAQLRADLRWWLRRDRKIEERIFDLVEAVIGDPVTGIGKPEKLKYLGSIWSRRITQEHRLVYQVSSDKIIFLQARYHYQ